MTRFVLILTMATFALAQPALRFKVPAAGPGSISASPQVVVPSPVPFGKGHVIVQFADGAVADGVAGLRARGARVLADVPDNAVLVAMEGSLDLTGLNATYAAPLAVEQKLSPSLDAATNVYVVEFHPDVAIADARRLILDARLELREHPDLAPHQLLAAESGRTRASTNVRSLAARDEVAYIFPASTELASGLATVACSGAITDNGAIGQYIATVGNGWDGPGLNQATLNYVFVKPSTRVPQDQAQAEIVRAMQAWNRAAAIYWVPGSTLTGARTVSIVFGRGMHGDTYPFDGRGRVLAHTFYPSPPNAEPLAGDMHFDDDEDWRLGANMDVFSVALHELGHALGLGHSDNPNAVMYPYYRFVSALHEEDVRAIQGMYAGPGGQTPTVQPPSNPTPPANPTPPVNPTPPTNPAPPTNPVPPPTPSPGDTTAPTLTIASPASTVTTSAASRVFTGTASDASGIASVTWSTNLGSSGIAQGATSWRAEIPLLRGYNTVTIRATDGAGNTAWRSVLVIRR